MTVLERLHSEIKSKQKELSKGVGKGNKAVDKARSDTQKHVERLGSHSATYHNATSKDADNDPYVLKRGINHRLNKQFQEENSNKQDLLAVQNNFSQFEAHVVQTFQHSLGQFNASIGSQNDQAKQLYAISTQTAQAVDPLHEWNLFVRRNNSTLIDPNDPPRTLDNAVFPHQDHQSTKPLCYGSLERKQGLMRKFDASFYAVTPSGFMHEFKSDDDTSKDPSPELSLFISDCTIGALNGNLFSIKGKDVSKGKVGSALSTSKEYEFRASSGRDAETWYQIIAKIAGKKPGDTMSPTSPSSASSPTGTLTSREREQQQIMSPTSEQQTGTNEQSPAMSGATGTAAPSTAAQDMAVTQPTTATGDATNTEMGGGTDMTKRI